MSKTVVKYQQYAEYKDSGVEWLGEVPSHWDLKPSKFLFNIVNGSTPKSGVEEYWEGDITWVTPSDLSKIESFEISESARSITNKGLDSCGTSLVPSGSLILSCRAPIGSLAITTTEVCTNQGCKSLVAIDEINTKFIYYFLSVSTEQLNILGRGTTFLELSSDELGNLKIPFPVVNEAEKIANFLDHETAKIDSLIAKQEKLIELLKEKRQAVISHAVTKGLNPNVSMKDSGVEWLGEVPEHWEISPIKFVLENKDYKRIPLSAEERGNRSGDYRYYGASGVIDYIDDYIFDEPNVLVGEDGANLVNRNTPLAFPAYGKYWVNNHAHILHPQDSLADYWAELIEIIDISPLVSGSAQPKLTAEALKNLKISFPLDLEERKAIDIFIKHQKVKFDFLISKATNQIELLKERRTALISSVVTGKIDVRNWQNPNKNNEAKMEFSA